MKSKQLVMCMEFSVKWMDILDQRFCRFYLAGESSSDNIKSFRGTGCGWGRLPREESALSLLTHFGFMSIEVKTWRWRQYFWMFLFTLNLCLCFWMLGLVWFCPWNFWIFLFLLVLELVFFSMFLLAWFVN